MSRIAIIGLGPMGLRHLKSVLELPNAVLSGISDLNLETVRRVIGDHGLSERIGFTSHREMVSAVNPDIVIIATNGPSHSKIFEDLVEDGVTKIFCEKPIATSLYESRMMQQTAKEKSVLLLVNHARRWMQDYKELKLRLQDGLIGQIHSVSYTMGGGQMACNGTHVIDIVSFLLDTEIKSVVGFLTEPHTANPRGAQFHDPGGYALLHFQNGARMFFEMPDDLGITPLLIINGSYGRVIIEELKGYYTIEARKVEDRILPVTRYGTPLHVVEKVPFKGLDLIRLCQQGIEMLMYNEPLINCSAAINSLEAIIAIHYSNFNQNKLITLPIKDNQIVHQQFSFT
ncbi:Gfo/Idh/MocA family protein [Paenibacillus thalictri]|uniref:Gfo/Idh/MocA family oxidoreductase n=1 Tax=Paenibacillus thalictri TaxID=2527873 RepID=A0A4Q9DLR4_9BACL|nr:Gfo/Idh/MocA family oxidoreductase [Paenibacillus thalictri]TBL73013.1 Gfo/Idh/MocA family oxidoreductase [Paenibacillus thalictri]